MIGKLFGFLTLASCCVMAQTTVRNDRFSLLFDDGKLWLVNAHGGKEISMGRMLFAWCPPVAVPHEVVSHGNGMIDLAYRVEKDETEKITVRSHVELMSHGFDVTYNLLVPNDFRGSIGGIMQEWKGVDKERQVGKIGVWTRSEKGGVPFEERDCYLRKIEGLAGEFDGRTGESEADHRERMPRSTA